MNGDNLVTIIKSPAFTILVGTVCVIAFMNHIPKLIITIKEVRNKD